MLRLHAGMAELVDALDLGSSELCLCRFESCSRYFFQLSSPMNELRKQLTDLGLTEELADKAILTVSNFVKAKLPESFHGAIDDVMAGNSPDMGGVLGKLGGLFGSK